MAKNGLTPELRAELVRLLLLQEVIDTYAPPDTVYQVDVVTAVMDDGFFTEEEESDHRYRWKLEKPDYTPRGYDEEWTEVLGVRFWIEPRVYRK